MDLPSGDVRLSARTQEMDFRGPHSRAGKSAGKHMPTAFFRAALVAAALAAQLSRSGHAVRLEDVNIQGMGLCHRTRDSPQRPTTSTSARTSAGAYPVRPAGARRWLPLSDRGGCMGRTGSASGLSGVEPTMQTLCTVPPVLPPGQYLRGRFSCPHSRGAYWVRRARFGAALHGANGRLSRSHGRRRSPSIKLPQRIVSRHAEKRLVGSRHAPRLATPCPAIPLSRRTARASG